MITHLSVLDFFLVFNVVKNTHTTQLLNNFWAKWVTINLHNFEPSHLSQILPFSCLFPAHSSFLSEATVPVILKAFAQHVKHFSNMHQCTTSTWGNKTLCNPFYLHMWHFQVKQDIQCEKCRTRLPTGFDWTVKSGRYI